MEFGVILDVITVAVIPALYMIYRQSQEIAKLRDEHGTIIKSQEKMTEQGDRFHSEVKHAIDKLQGEHYEHNEIQAKMLQLLSILERRSDKLR